MIILPFVQLRFRFRRRGNSSRFILLFCLLGLAIGYPAAVQSAGAGRQALTTSVLKVCADPANLPFSNDKLEGLENAVVELLAEELDRQVRYTWYPQSTGFVRNTLKLRECDLISGITTTSETVQNTNPYYYSVYTMVYRADSGLQATTMSDPSLRDQRLGVVAGTPPADILAREGLLGNVTPYQLVTDTRRERPAYQALLDVVEGSTDVAFLWGPIAGYYARQFPEADLRVVPLINEGPQVRLDFRVSMAVRYHETEWKHTVNTALKARQDEIQQILHRFGVPLLNDRSEIIAP